VSLKKFNKNRIGKKYEDFYNKETSKKTKDKISRATRIFSLKTGRVPPSRKGIKSTMPKEFFQRIGALSILSQNNRKTPTSIERKLYKYLEFKKIIFNKQHFINHFVVDAYIPKLNLIIEADGIYWHNLEKNKKKDKAKTAYLEKCGYELLRLSEDEINNNSFVNKLEYRFK